MGPPHLGVYLCKAENEIGGDQRGITLTGEIFLQINVDNDNISLFAKKQIVGIAKIHHLCLLEALLHF